MLELDSGDIDLNSFFLFESSLAAWRSPCSQLVRLVPWQYSHSRVVPTNDYPTTLQLNSSCSQYTVVTMYTMYTIYDVHCSLNSCADHPTTVELNSCCCCSRTPHPICSARLLQLCTVHCVPNTLLSDQQDDSALQ